MMEIAKCTENGVIYTSVDFSRLPLEEIVWKRRVLQCPECGCTAFFRNASFNGSRTSCFGARPHAEGCKLAAHDIERPLYIADPDALHMPDGKIVVNFGFGSPAQFQSASHREADPYNSLANSGQSGIEIQRRLSSLLRLLITFPAFSCSDQTIEVHGCSDFTVANFFVPIALVSQRYIGQYRGFWGLLSDLRISDDKSTIWFNCAGTSLSFCLDSKYFDELNQRYCPRNEEDFAGAYILVMGRLSTAENKRLYAVIDGIEHMAIRFTQVCVLR